MKNKFLKLFYFLLFLPSWQLAAASISPYTFELPIQEELFAYKSNNYSATKVFLKPDINYVIERRDFSKKFVKITFETYFDEELWLLNETVHILLKLKAIKTSLNWNEFYSETVEEDLETFLEKIPSLYHYSPFI